VKTLVSGGISRSYRLHVPASYTGDTPVPVVFSFHGLGSNAVEQEFYSGFAAKSDTTGFISVFPDGTTIGSGQTHWNAWQLAPPQPDEVAFTSAMIDVLVATLCIDQSRVYTSGMSNGAMMSVRLACSLSARIAAFGPVAGAYFPAMSYNVNAFETCPDAVPRPMIAFHGTADATVPFNGGGTVNYRLPQDDNTPADDVLSSWAAHNGCSGARQETQIDTEVRLVQYGSCADGALVQLYAVDGGGHTWPGSFDVPGLGYTTQQIDATDLMWAFFSNYTLPDADVDLIPDANDNCPIDENFSQANTDANFIDLSPPKAYDDLTLAFSDTLGDACDPDDDNDGLADVAETTNPACPMATGTTIPLVADSDGDRVLDGAECALGKDPVDTTMRPSEAECGLPSDTDGDGVLDFRETCYFGTDPGLLNTDGDTCHDGKEVASINLDSNVTAIDLSQVAQSFGPSTGQNYILDFDMTRDGTIGAIDLGFVAQRFGAC
jgi:polyhydroxybutyrate depolymerase